MVIHDMTVVAYAADGRPVTDPQPVRVEVSFDGLDGASMRLLDDVTLVANRETVTDFVVARYFADGEEYFWTRTDVVAASTIGEVLLRSGTEGRMNTNPEREAVGCRESIKGPKVKARVVAWRHLCGNRTRHPSGFCHVHRDDGWYLGKRSEEDQP